MYMNWKQTIQITFVSGTLAFGARSSLLNWDTESVLALNEKLKVKWNFSFLFSAKTLSLSQLSKVNCT